MSAGVKNSEAVTRRSTSTWALAAPDSAATRHGAPADRAGRPGSRSRSAPAAETPSPGVHGVGRAHQQPAVVLAEGRDQLEQLVGHAEFGGRGASPRSGDLLHLVDEQHQFVEFGKVGEGLAQRCRQPAGPAGRQPGGKSSTKGQPRREAIALAKLVLPVPGGPNRITAWVGGPRSGRRPPDDPAGRRCAVR